MNINPSTTSPAEAQAISHELAKREADRIEHESALAELNSDKALASVIAEAAAMGIREPIEPLLHSTNTSVVVDKASGTISVLKPKDSLPTQAVITDDGKQLKIGDTLIDIVEDSNHRQHALLSTIEYNPTESQPIDLAKVDALIQQARKAGTVGQELAQRLEVMAASQMSQETF